MSEPRLDGPFEVPVGRLAGGRDQRRHALVAVLTIVLAVGGAIGLARLAGNGTGQAPVPGPSGGDTAVRGSPQAGSGAPSASPRRSSGPRIERLLDAPDVALLGAPRVLLVERDGLDVQLLEWTAGAGLASVRTFPRAIGSAGEDVIPVLAPTDDRILLFTPGRQGDPKRDRATVVDASGRVAWSGEDLASASGAAWSPDGSTVVVAGNGRRWHLIRIGARGAAVDDVVILPFRVFLPTPLPTSSLSIPRVDPRTVPLGFSSDGHWVYGGVVSAELGILIATFRIAIDGSVVEPVADLGVGQAGGLVPGPGALGGALVDPSTGRIATVRVNAGTSGGPPTIEVRNPDAGFAFSVGGATPIGSGWGADGALFVLSADSPLYADRVELVRYSTDGSAGPPILTMGPLTSADFLGIRNGYAALAGTMTRPTRATQLILVDLADPARIAAIPLPEDSVGTIVGVELRP